MVTSRYKSLFLAAVLLCAILCIVPSVSAEGKVTIEYRGSGGNYIGDTIVFNGLNTAGNSTVIKISGHGLPAEGVPLFDLDGVPGSGNTFPVDSRHLWLVSWDMTRIDTSKLVTSRYTFTAWDKEHPEISATTSVFLKKPEFYMEIRPSTSGTIGDYLEIDGMAEKGVSYIRLDIKDGTGTILHTFMTPVSALGFFQHGFRIDMQPGEYYITGTNPAMTKTLTSVITVTRERETEVTGTPVVPAVTAAPAGQSPGAPAPESTAAQPAPVPTRAGNVMTTLALVAAGLCAVAFLSRRS